MASKRTFLILISLHFSLIGLCQFENQLQQADSLFGEGEDSLGYLIIQDLQPETAREKLWIAKLKGDYFFGKHMHEEAVKEYKALLVPFDSTDEDLTTKIARGINDMGIVYYRLSKRDSAIFAHQKSIKIYQIHDNHQGQAFNYNNMAILYSLQEKWDTVIYLYEASLEQAILAKDTIGIGFNHLNLGVHNYEHSNITKAIDHYERSREIFQKTGNDAYIMHVNRKLYALYRNLKDFNTFRPILYEVKKYDESKSNTYRLSRTYTDLAKMHQVYTKNLDSTKYYIQKGLEITNVDNDPIGYQLLLLERGHVFFTEEKYKEALELFKNIQEADADAYTGIVATYWIAEIHHVLENYQEAIDALAHFQTYDSLTIRNQDWYHYYNILHQAHMLLGNTKQAEKYYGLFKDYEQKVFDRENNLEVARIEYRNQLERERALQKAREEKLQLEIERRQLIIYGTLLLLALLLVLAIVIYRSYQRKRRDNQQLGQKNTELKKLRESERIMAENEKLLLQESIDTKDRQLASTTMLSLEKNKMIDQLDNRLKILEQLDLANVKEEVHQMKKILRAHMSMETSWENFAFQFEQVHPNFFKKIEEQFPETTVNDRKICAYIRIGFGNNEIAQATNLTLAAVKKSVNRLKKRLGLGADDNLREFVGKI